MSLSISAVILTFNEEMHIKRCIESLLPVVEHIYILDSYSTDSTIELVSKYNNVSILKNKFINHATQFNHALDNFDIKSDWIMRIDADEYIEETLSKWLITNLHGLSNDINGIYFNRYIKFIGRLMLRGGMSSYWILRLWRNEFGRCEQRWMDEHILLSSGRTIKASGKLIDDNLNSLSWWTHKHVDYSTREAIDILIKEKKVKNIKASLLGVSAERTRFFKNIYNKVPLFIRPFCYFIFRYFLKFGFLDGKEGFLWAILQGFWYRMMVDAKVFEIKKAAKERNLPISQIVKEKYGYEI